MSQRPAEIGEVIGGYQLESVLGQGGMGCVYEATHTRLGRRTALKLLATSLVSSDEYVSRFLSEAKIVNDVRHPNIVDIYDFIELEEPKRVAYVMELVDGPSLGKLLKEQRLSLRQAINATFQLVSALESVHNLGVIHRDLKPENILVLADPTSDFASVPSVKILDFGIAKSVDADVQHKTITGSMLGTPAYMAPEQIAAHPVSGATDVYAIGEIFYEMISGQRLYRDDRMRMLSAKLLGEVPELVLPDDVPTASSVQELVRWCLALDPEDRPSIAELANALSELLAMSTDAPIAATRLARPPPLAPMIENTASPMASMIALRAPPSSRTPWMIAAGFGALALAAGVFVWSTSQPTPGVVSAPQPVITAPAPAPAPAAEAKAMPKSEEAEDKSKPEAKPEPEKKREPEAEPKRQPKQRRRRARRQKPPTRPVVAPQPKTKKVVKKRELVPW